jgi:hypothetical protein
LPVPQIRRMVRNLGSPPPDLIVQIEHVSGI